MKRFLIILLFPIVALSQEISGELTYFGPAKPIKLGSFFRAKLLLGPKGEEYLKDLEKAVNKTFIQGLYLQEVRGLQVLQGGDDFLEADLVLVAISPLGTSAKYVWKVGEKEIPFNLKNFMGEAPDLQPKDFIILGQPVKKEWFYLKLGILLLTLIILLVGYLLWKRAKNKSRLKALEQKKREEIDIWAHQIINATERGHFEHLFENRQIWLELIPSLGEKTGEFFSAIDKHQYKPSWTEEELKEVVNSAEDLKRMARGV